MYRGKIMLHTTSRRRFLQSAGAFALSTSIAGRLPATEPRPKPPKQALPRWRGFNLINFFQALSSGEPGDMTVREDDLRWMADWGFDFVRLPMDYWMWIDSDWRKTRTLTPDDLFKIKESTLEKVDRAVELCVKYGLHVNLNFHRAPGYCINNPDREPVVLWKDKIAQEAFVFHWTLFAKRYRGFSREQVSFNLVNEAPTPKEGYMTADDYCRVMKLAIDAIRAVSPDRIIIVDGLSVGRNVVEGLIPTKVAQSTHAYYPAQISHYRASWVDKESKFPTPTWPILNKDGSIKIGRETLEELYRPWGELARNGIGVHCGECGCFNKTPYRVFLGWFEDVLDILTGHGIGYALWNFRGPFGILDSDRTDIIYEDWHGHQLDRTLLNLLQRY